eukprot:5644667-Pleurochrysis_carterae.AAC.4
MAGAELSLPAPVFPAVCKERMRAIHAAVKSVPLNWRSAAAIAGALDLALAPRAACKPRTAGLAAAAMRALVME